MIKTSVLSTHLSLDFVWWGVQYLGLNTLCLLDMCSTLELCLHPFSFSYFSGRVLCFCLGQHNPTASTFFADGIISVIHHTQLVFWDKVLLTFLLLLALTHNLPISYSRVSRIMTVCHHSGTNLCFFWCHDKGKTCLIHDLNTTWVEGMLTSHGT
jgi:hypothetical protein